MHHKSITFLWPRVGREVGGFTLEGFLQQGLPVLPVHDSAVQLRRWLPCTVLSAGKAPCRFGLSGHDVAP